MIGEQCKTTGIKEARRALKQHFGYDSFRPLQEEVIGTVLNKEDCLVIMPTGGGKSLCYQLPALLFSGLTVVISPLISLMKDQVEQLREAGVASAYLNSSLSFEEYRETMDRVVRGEIKLLYLAPETLLKPQVGTMLSRVRVDCLTIDEAHCISAWGHDFRPEYRQIAAVRAHFPQAVCIALTATATPRVREDIKRSLNIEAGREFLSSFDRPNLFISIVPKEKPLLQTIDFIKRFPDQSGIIYCISRSQVETLYHELADQGFSVRPYHAGLPDREREQNQELFIKDDVKIIVATVAFGMGINKPDVRFVLHYELPQNIEGYYQQIGRAGRDGLKSQCMLLFNYGDTNKIRFFIKQKSEVEQRVAQTHLNALLSFAESDLCRRRPMLEYFGERYSEEKCGMCDNCLDTGRKPVDMTEAANKFLSCVIRTGELYGTNHIIEVLRGSTSKRVLDAGHQHVTTYNIGRELTKKQWAYLSRRLLSTGFLVQDTEHGSLKTTPKRSLLFQKKERFLIKMERTLMVDSSDSSKADEAPQDYDTRLYATLKVKRKELADNLKVAPYIIFSDKSLIDMATYFPHSKENMLRLHGIGELKAERYGEDFLALIHSHCKEHNQEEIVKESAKSAKAPATKPAEQSARPAAKRKFITIGEQLNSGKTIDTLANEHKVKITTIIDNLYKFLSEGYKIDETKLIPFIRVDTEEQERILEAFRECGSDYLKPVYDHLKGQVSYDDLKVLRLVQLIKNRS